MKEGNIYIYGIISPWQDSMSEEFGEVNLKQVVNQINNNKDAEILNVHIRSEGGDVNEGFAIHDALVNSGKEIKTIGEGIVASIATVIFLAGSTRSMSKNAEFMIHNPWSVGVGAAEDLEKQASELRKVEDNIISFYAEKTGTDADILRELMNNETYMTSDEALSYNFATEIMQPLKAVALINNQKQIKMDSKELEKKVDEKLDGFWNKISKKFGLSKDKNLVLTTGSGEILDFGDKIHDESEIEEGVTAKIGENLADGEILMPSGDTFVFNAGTLVEIKEKEEEDVMAQMKAKNEELSKQIEELNEKTNALAKEKEDMRKDFEDEMKKVKAEIKSDIETFGKKETPKNPNAKESKFSAVFNQKNN